MKSIRAGLVGLAMILGPSTLFCGLGSLIRPAAADQTQLDEDAIKSALAKMNDADEVVRDIAASKALKAEDPVLRSLALRNALQSKDGVIRELGYNYLLDIQKLIIVYVDTSSTVLASISEKDRPKFIGFKTIQLTITRFSTKEETFTASLGGGSSAEGTISKAGLTAVLQSGCRLQLGSALEDQLVGNVTCGVYSFAAKADLP